MWTITVNNKDENVADVTASFSNETTSFSWNATIKVAETDTFVQTAKEQLEKHKTLHENDNELKELLETKLNK